MARNRQDIEKEIQRIDGQLLVAKQICRENLKEINHLKKQQENDYILCETNRLLSIQTLDSHEHVEDFNKLLHLVYEEQKQERSLMENTIEYNEQEKKNEKYNSLLRNLSSNINELESLFEYGKNLFTQPITSINMLNNTISLQEITDDHLNNHSKEHESIEINDLHKRIDIMHKKLRHIHQCDDCSVQ